MKKLIRHKWKIFSIDTKICTRCGATKTYDYYRDKTIFYDRFGKLHLTTPECELPNIKL